MPAANRPRLSWARRARNSARVALLSARERNLPAWPAERIEALQRRRLRAIVGFAYETVPHYRRALDERGLRPGDFRTAEDLERLPLIDGRMVREQPEAFASSAYDDRSRETLHTSGTDSGVRRTIHWDDDYVLHTIAAAERERAILMRLTGESRAATALRELVGRGGGDARISIFPGDSSSRVMRVLWSERTLLPARTEHHEFLRPHQPFEEVVAQLDAVRPRLVFSFGSYAEQFFRRLAHGGADVHLPRVWAYTSDTMSPDIRELAEKRFGCAIYSIYSAIEAHRLALQCERRRGFHLNVDQFAMRLVDDRGATVPPGTPGELVVSNLVNRATVLLNYRLGDRGVLARDPCPCGRSLPLLERFDGRQSEMFAVGGGRQVSSLELEGMLRAELRDVLKVQFAQPAADRLVLRVVPLGSIDGRGLRDAVAARLAPVLGGSGEVTVEVVDEIAPAPSGKHRRAVLP